MGKNTSSYNIIILTFICVIFCALSLFISYPHDDAFISFRYARNLINGYGLVFNPGGERVEGYSNFFWVLLISLSFLIHVSPFIIAKAFGIISGLIVIILSYYWGRRMAGGNRTAPLLAALAVGANLSVASWATTGLETDMFALFVLGGVLAYLRESDGKGRGVWWGALFALAALTRPEGWFLPILLWGFELAWLLVIVKKYPEEHRGSPWRTLTMGALVFLVIFIPYFVWRWTYYGYIFPNTYYAKVGFTTLVLERGIRYTGSFINRYNLVFILFIPSLFVVNRLKEKDVWLAMWMFFFWVFFAVAVGGDHMSFYRLFVPALPFAVIWGEKVFLLISEKRSDVQKGLIISVVFLLWLMPWLNPRVWRDVGWNRNTYSSWVAAGNALKGYAKPGESLALTTAGAIPFVSDLETIDMLGLNDIHTAHMPAPENMGEGGAGHEKGDAQYVLSRKPKYIIFFPWITKMPQTSLDDGLKTAVLRVEKEVANNPEFRQHYQVIPIRMDGGLYFNVFRRAD